MSKTPVKLSDPESHRFSPKEIFSPNKDVPGVSKTVFTHISRLHGLLTDWIRVRDKGTKICKGILALKLHECSEDYYPQVLRPLIESLVDALESLENFVEDVQTIEKQLQALAQLQPTDQPAILTWSVTRICNSVSEILNCLQKEHRLKQVITENIAHSRDEDLIELYASSWEFEAYFDTNSVAYLFAEVGLSGIT